MSSLEDLLNDQQNRQQNIKEKLKNYDDGELLKSDKSATLPDLISMINKIVTVTMKDINVEFVPDEGKSILTDAAKQLDKSYITYKLLYRSPKDAKKPMIREFFDEQAENKGNRIGEIYSQKFVCSLQFNVLANECELANTILEKFEEIMITYAGYFKKNGVAELYMDKQLTDSSYDPYRQIISVRNIIYSVEIEKITVIFKEKIKEIDIESID